MFQKSLFQKLRQVTLTYLTWRWVWLLLIPNFLLILYAFFTQYSDPGTIDDSLPVAFGTVIPLMTCLTFFMMVTKWQFTDPRARLIPGFARPHLAVLSAILAILSVANPLILAFRQGIPPLGPLAFALLLGGVFLHGIHFHRVTNLVPMMAVYLSSFYPTSNRFWFSTSSDFYAIHMAIAFTGTLLIGWSLWRLTTLCEEDEGYYIIAIGSSRLEHLLQERLKNRKIARGGIAYRFADRWHNRLTSLKNPGQAALLQWGWLRFSHSHQAIAAGFVTALYGILLGCIGLWVQGKVGIVPSIITLFMAFALPPLGPALLLRSRRVRMALELLRPASRKAYFDGLFKSLLKLTLYYWLAMCMGVCVVSMAISTDFKGDFMQLATGFLVLSSAVQLPTLAILLRMAQWHSNLLFAFGCYGIVCQELGLFVAWTILQKTYGPIPTALLAAIVLSALALPLRTWARNAWLRAELA